VAVQDVIGVTVTQNETNSTLGDDPALDPVEAAAAPPPDQSPAAGTSETTAASGTAPNSPDLVEPEAEADYLDEDGDDDEPFVLSPYDQPGRWFVVHTYAGYENKVKSNLHSRAVSMNMEDRIYEVVIPMEDVVEF
jgi:transcriptional antiterminator NusG